MNKMLHYLNIDTMQTKKVDSKNGANIITRNIIYFYSAIYHMQ